jgi:hypothetical protein
MEKGNQSPGFYDIPSGFDYDAGQDPYEGQTPEELAELTEKSKEIDDFHHHAQSEFQTAIIP